MFGQTATFRQRSCLFHTSIIGIKNKLTKQTVKILMRRLIRSRLMWISTVCKCMSEFTWCPKLPDFTLLFSVRSCGSCCDLPQDCQAVKDMGHHNSGVYHVYPGGVYSGFEVYCDMETDGGGWLVRNIHIIIIATWSGILYHVEWMKSYHRISQDAKRRGWSDGTTSSTRRDTV